MTPNQFGKNIMKWGSGTRALTRIGTLTVSELQSAGITLEMARQWRDFYVRASVEFPDNPSAPYRAALMAHAAKLLADSQ
jgi:hypothetical protein